MTNQQFKDLLSGIEQAVKTAYEQEKQNQNFSYLSLNQTLEESGCRSAQTLYAWIRESKFPEPYRLVKGGRAVGWRSDEVQEWKLSRQKASIEGGLQYAK